MLYFICKKKDQSRDNHFGGIFLFNQLLIRTKKHAYYTYRFDRSPQILKYYQSIRNLTLSSVRRRKRAYPGLLESQKSSWLQLASLNIKTSAQLGVPDALCDPTVLDDYFMSVFDPGLCIFDFYAVYEFQFVPLDPSAKNTLYIGIFKL